MGRNLYRYGKVVGALRQAQEPCKVGEPVEPKF